MPNVIKLNESILLSFNIDLKLIMLFETVKFITASAPPPWLHRIYIKKFTTFIKIYLIE